MISKLKVLNLITETEDAIEEEFKSVIKEKVIQKVKEVYGEEGLKVASYYYSDNDVDIEKDDCPDCAEKARKLIESINTTSQISSSLSDESVTNYHKVLEYKVQLKSLMNDLIRTVKNRLNIDYDSQFDDQMICKSIIKTAIERIEKK